MTRRTASLFIVAGLLGLASPGMADDPDWRQLRVPPLDAFTPAQPRRVELPNGLVLMLQEDHELPLIRGIARIRGGSRDEPAMKVGLASIYGQVWRTGGTRSRTGDELDDFLEARAARVESGSGIDATTLSWNCLAENLDEVFPVFLDLLRNPEFREDKIALAKDRLYTEIARRNDDPTEIADREAQRLGYGADSPYARLEEYATVASVERADLVSWHDRYVRPNATILGVVGDFHADQMEARLRKALASWPRGEAVPAPPAQVQDPKPGVYLVAKEDVNQSNIRMVHAGARKDSPDFYALEVMNEIFGGGFASRLVTNVRSRKGLAYYVSGGVGTAFDHSGLFTVAMGTKSETTAAGIDALLEEMGSVASGPFTEDELERAKDAILNSFVFTVDSKEKVLFTRMRHEFYGYPADFLERYRTGVERVTLEDVARVAREYVHRDRIALLVVGKEEDFDRPLSSFGPVTRIDVSIPGPASVPAPSN